MLQLPRTLSLRNSTFRKFRVPAHHEARRRDVAEIPGSNGNALAVARPEGPLAGKWLETAERVVGFLKDTSPGIVGVMGLHENSGSARLTQTLAHAYKLLDRRVLIVNAAGPPAAAGGALNGFSDTTDVWHSITHDGYFPTLDLAHDPAHASSKQRFEASCTALRESYDLILVDLPVAATTLTEVSSQSRIAAQACDAVLCICLTEMATHADLAAKMQLCKLLGIRVAGLIVNDERWSLAKVLHR